MFLRQLDLTTALRPNLSDDESLLFVQHSVGLYEGKFKIPNYQNGHLYLTSHRVCYVDNEDPRQYSVAVDLKEIERTEFYAGFLKSSPKITLFPKPVKRSSQAFRSPAPQYASPSPGLGGAGSTPPRSMGQSPAPARDLNATWICTICGMSNAVPSNFDPSTANEHTLLPPCQACGIKPTYVHVFKAAIAAMSKRTDSTPATLSPHQIYLGGSTRPDSNGTADSRPSNVCPRCTFSNHPSLSACEICGASLETTVDAFTQGHIDGMQRSESPGPTLTGSIIGDDTIETIKFSFRNGGSKPFLDKLDGALVQRKWLLQSAPPVPKPAQSGTPQNGSPWLPPDDSRTSTPQRVVGIAGLERRGAELRQNNQAVIGTAFEDLEALMTSAKEVIAMAEQFSKQADHGGNSDAAEARILSDSASAMGLVTTKDMLGTGSTLETFYLTQLSRNLAEFLTDDRRGILRKEGGIMSLVDLWSVFNRTRNGIELISPLEFEKASVMWESLNLPIRLRRFKSGLLVVQEKSRTDEKTITSLLKWLQEPHTTLATAEPTLFYEFGRGATAQETAERFGWSVGVATEELEMAEEADALCRDQCLDGTRFWKNHFGAPTVQSRVDDETSQRMDDMMNQMGL